MAKEQTLKKTFGGGRVAKISPPLPDDGPKKINITVSFEDALKLHLSLGQALAKINTYKHSTSQGKRAAVNVCLHRDVMRITVLEGQLPADTGE